MLTVCRSLIWHTGIAERWFLTSIKNTYETSLLKTSLPCAQLIPVGGAINFPYILVLMLIFWLCGVSSRRDLAHPFFQSTVSTVQQQYITLLLTENTLGDHKDSHPYCAQPSTRLLHPYLE